MRTADRAEIRASVEAALVEAEEAHEAYHRWMADWLARHGHHGPYDAFGFPIKQTADLEA